MYRIYKRGKLLGKVDVPIYIKKQYGVFVPCVLKEAEGIAYNSTPYSLEGQTMDGSQGEVILVETDDASELIEQEAVISLTMADEKITSMIASQNLMDELIENGIVLKKETFKELYKVGNIRKDQLNDWLRKNKISQEDYDFIIG